MPHLILWACQLFLSWSLKVWMPIGFFLTEPFPSSQETSLGRSIDISISDSVKRECALMLTFLRQKCHFEKFPSLIVSVLRWHKVHFSFRLHYKSWSPSAARIEEMTSFFLLFFQAEIWLCPIIWNFVLYKVIRRSSVYLDSWPRVLLTCCRHSLVTCQGMAWYLDTILKALEYEGPDTRANLSLT